MTQRNQNHSCDVSQAMDIVKQPELLDTEEKEVSVVSESTTSSINTIVAPISGNN